MKKLDRLETGKLIFSILEEVKSGESIAPRVYILLKLISQTREEWLKDVLWLIDCEENCAKTAGYETIELTNLRKRIDGHFNLSKLTK